MNELIFIKYIGNHSKIGNLTNFINQFLRDSGIIPRIFDEENKEEIIQYLKEYNNPESNLIIHIQSHGWSEGIGKELPVEKPNVIDSTTLITWKELIDIFNIVANLCNKLTVNLGTVCNSYHIANTDKILNFDIIIANGTVTNTVIPRKINKKIFEGENNLILDSAYTFIHKNH